jgi:hypothetical protein
MIETEAKLAPDGQIGHFGMSVVEIGRKADLSALSKAYQNGQREAQLKAAFDDRSLDLRSADQKHAKNSP